MMTARVPFISSIVTALHFFHQLPGVNFQALSFSAIVFSANLFIPSINIWKIASSKKRLKKSSEDELAVKVVLSPGCWVNGVDSVGVSNAISCMGVQLLSMLLLSFAPPPLPRPLPHPVLVICIICKH